MFSNVKIKAVAFGALFGFVLPYVIAAWFKVSVIGDVKQPHLEAPAVDYTMAYVFLFGLGPLIGGAVAAYVSRTQPILHAALAALAGWLFYALFGAGILLGLLCVGVSIAGAMGWKKFRG